MEKENQRRCKVIKVKQSFEWNVVFDYLQMFNMC